MQACGMLDEERIRHESQHGIGAAELRDPALLGRVIDRGETARLAIRRRPPRRRGKFVDERLGVPCRARISRCAEHQGRQRTCQ